MGGLLTSRQNAAVEEADLVSTNAYKYPPRSGKKNNESRYKIHFQKKP